MAIDSSTLLNWPFPEIEHTYTARDAMLYALGVGLGHPAGDPRELRFVYEAGMAALPSMCVVLGTPGFWVKDPATGITWQKVLHGEQGFRIHQPLPAATTVLARNRVAALLDKGEGKGALVFVEREIREKASGALLATLTSTYFCRADGGFGGSTIKEAPKPAVAPQRAADRVTDFKIDPRAHLLYRLNGDYNPIHADPAAAKSAGFERPIFHGLGSLGVAAQVLLGTESDWQPERMRSMNVRFTSPVFPGETIRVHAWREAAAEGARVFFRCEAVERGVVVLDNGLVQISA